MTPQRGLWKKKVLQAGVLFLKGFNMSGQYMYIGVCLCVCVCPWERVRERVRTGSLRLCSLLTSLLQKLFCMISSLKFCSHCWTSWWLETNGHTATIVPQPWQPHHPQCNAINSLTGSLQLSVCPSVLRGFTGTFSLLWSLWPRSESTAF